MNSVSKRNEDFDYAEGVTVVSTGYCLPEAISNLFQSNTQSSIGHSSLIGTSSLQAGSPLEGSASQDPWITPDHCEKFLKDRKSLKFMAKQDRLALISAKRTLENANWMSESDLASRTGLYFTMGLLPFEKEYLDILATKSIQEAEFSMERFSKEAYLSVNPLLTFKCLPNMPLFHISANLGVKESYLASYPGTVAFMQNLQEACFELKSGRIDFALVGAVIDQQNELMEWYFKKQSWHGKYLPFDGAISFLLSRETEMKGLLLAELLAASWVKEAASARAKFGNQVKAQALEDALLLLSEISRSQVTL